MKRKLVLALMVLALVAFGTGTAMSAGLLNSSHNMILHQDYTGGAAQKGACSFCHIPHGAGGQKLFPTAIADVATGSQWDNDPIAAICWACHNDASGYTDAAEINPFQSGSHGRDLSVLESWGDALEATLTDAVYGTSTHATLGAVVGCQSCHNIHDNTYRPFLRSNTTGSLALVAGDFLTFCEDCHVARDENDGGNAGADARQNHPASNVVLAEAGTNANLLQFGVDAYGTDFNSTWALLTQEANTPTVTGNHWNLGAKFEANAGAAVTGEINCGTCHVVHWNELGKGDAGYGVADGLAAGTDVTLAVNFGHNDLTVYSSDPSGTASADICSQCHDYTNATSGPGALATFSHPFNNTFDGTAATGFDVTEPAGTKWLNTDAANQVIVCQSCHDMHFATNYDDTAVGPPNYEYALQAAYCSDCHSGTGAGNFKPGHHPSGFAVTGDTDLRADGTGTEIGTDMDWSSYVVAGGAARTQVMVNMITTDPTGWTGSTNYYDFPGGVMGCMTCHAGPNASAHNNATSFPGVAGVATDDSMCVDCHGVNPSWFTGHNTTDAGTHVLGEIATANYKWAQGSGSAVTPEAGATAPINYSSDGSFANSALICTSCHIIKTDTGQAIFSNNGDSDAGSTNYNAAERTNEDSDNENSTLDGIGMLLSSAGNNDNGGTTVYLCTSCHGGAPGTGSTHPVLPNYTTSMGTVTANNANIGENGVTHVGTNTDGSSTGQINCESCHRAHDADTDGSTYILETAGAGTGGYIDEAVLCNACHAK
ncbi:MAG: cytochrome c3 family protein [bacterium]|nr:cytochrome c3 family protein [bacterium]